ncbi:MAG: hypothetical protein KDA84_10655 [Planctomycetaceae bacterium]|nr:hypothetical protein [Planctomycetaceae bacterium]
MPACLKSERNLMVPDKWTLNLADAIAASLFEFAPQLKETEIVLLQVTCLPWHGLLGLSILTAEEFAKDPNLLDPTRTMEWQHGEFTEELQVWESTTPLAQEMRAIYERSSDRPAMAIEFLQACARAAETSLVANALSGLKRTDEFRISVPHPDNHREFFRLEKEPE